MNPSRAQYRMLHVLSRGKLIFQALPVRRLEIKDKTHDVDESWQFREITARTVVDRGWAAIEYFDPTRAEYGITIDGLALAQDLCDCKWVMVRGEKMKDHNLPESREKLAGKLLCRRCGRSVRCVSKKTPPHGAVRWNPRWGPVCASHPK